MDELIQTLNEAEVKVGLNPEALPPSTVMPTETEIEIDHTPTKDASRLPTMRPSKTPLKKA